jgi:hypothetical protein
MKLEIYIDENKLELINISQKEYIKVMKEKRQELELLDLAFPSMKLLKGDKNILKLAFDSVKQENY